MTVVAKLFGCVRPDLAIFGEKDYQQLRIITQMASDLDLGVEIVGHPIVRDADGLAQSSRNVRLTPKHRAAAVCVPRSLDAAIAAAAHTADVADIVRHAVEVIEAESCAAHEYTSVVDAESLDAITTIAPGQRVPGAIRIATAVWFGDVRLIDNRDLFHER